MVLEVFLEVVVMIETKEAAPEVAILEVATEAVIEVTLEAAIEVIEVTPEEVTEVINIAIEVEVHF